MGFHMAFIRGYTDVVVRCYKGLIREYWGSNPKELPLVVNYFKYKSRCKKCASGRGHRDPACELFSAAVSTRNRHALHKRRKVMILRSLRCSADVVL